MDLVPSLVAAADADTGLSVFFFFFFTLSKLDGDDPIIKKTQPHCCPKLKQANGSMLVFPHRGNSCKCPYNYV